jgi:hypothetical protein
VIKGKKEKRKEKKRTIRATVSTARVVLYI